MVTTTSDLLRIRGESLELLDAAGMPRWSVAIGSILLIAEYTTNEGPYTDDYFLVFVTAEDSKLYFSSCPSSARLEEGLNLLQQRLGSPIQLELQGSTEWRSRVAWPSKMRGTEYFSFKPASAETLREKVKKRLFGPTYEYALSNAVQEFLNEQLKAI